ncbi:hypothetical protein D3C73_971240 [compost metagenome]
MDVFGDDHATDHCLDRRNPDEATIRLRAFKAHHLQLLPFEHQAVALEHARHQGLGWGIGAHLRPPIGHLALDGLLDVIHGWLRGEHPGFGERGHQGVQAEVVIRVAVADVDGGQALAAGADFLHHLGGLLATELRVHQDRILLAADQHRGHGKNRLLAGVVDVQGQAGSAGVGGEGESGGCQEYAFEQHVKLRLCEGPVPCRS